MKKLTPIVLFLAAPQFAVAAPLNPWQAPMEPAQVSLSPGVVGSGSSADGAFSASVGVVDGVDMNVTVGSALSAGLPGSSWEVLPRAFLTDSLGLGVRVGGAVEGGDGYVAPELHGVWSFGSLDLTINAGGSFATNGGGAPEALAIVAPDFWITDRISTFVEVDASASSGAGVAADVLPGVSANIDPDGVHGVCLAVGLPVGVEDPAPYLGFWYALTFDASGRSSRRLDPVARRSVDPAALALQP
jgi:hypothetical protein